MVKFGFLWKLLFVIILSISSLGFAQLSKTHFIPPLTESGSNSSLPQDHYLYISTPSISAFNFTIKPVGLGPANYITGTVSKATPFVYNIGNGRNTPLFINVNETSTIRADKGFIIEAQSPIYVSVRLNAGNSAQAGALVSKGLSALGDTFRIGTFTNQAGRTTNPNNGNVDENLMSFISVMATEDLTIVNFSDISNNTEVENFNGIFPLDITLNKGESYVIAMNSYSATYPTNNKDGLIGALVKSDKPIAVNCGSANGSFDNGNGRDYGIDQIVGLDKVGTEYIFVRGDGNNDWENVLIVAHVDNTSIAINGNTTITINSGEYYVIEGGFYNTNGNIYVQTSQPVFAYQGIGGLDNNGVPNEANQGMFFVPPLSCETRGNLDNIANINNIGNTNYSGGISIVTKVGSQVTINNTPISNFNPIGPSAVDGNSNYITYKIKGLTGNISVESSDELYCAYFNYNGVATSGSFYSGFPSAPEINFDVQFASLGNCIPNIKLEAANIQNFDSFRWLFDDGNGSGFMDLLNNNSEITPALPGKYKLIGIIACTGEELESVEIPVSICPDDTDNDGIIDNIDIDNDNDGILNCNESKGDVLLNLSNVVYPELIFQDNSRDNTIASGIYSQSSSSGNINTFTGNSSGGFTSTLTNDTNAENSYRIDFTEPVNLKYEESISHPSIDGEYFIASILPVNKNMTLVDSDDRLLVDTNFDGVFEAGVTIISGSEIHFKINPSPNGNTPYQFFANQIDGFTFIHKLENTNTTSIFTGGLSLTCFKNDNDFDGIEDALDLDSDNDGIPDFIENTGILQPLSGIDTDLNGLDDMYDLAGTPLDTDGDTVPDFYDLDSDNDGITDLIETGQLGLLSDTDLNGIEDGPNYGANGWADAAETFPDSGIIVYTLNDLDTDSIFSFIDSDSDGDGCSDVLEAGFSDANNDDYLGDGIVVVDTTPDSTTGQGLVTNASDGYTLPNSNYLNFAPIIITTQPIDIEVCEESDNNISLISSTFDTIQWEVSSDAVNWTPIIDDAVYSNSQTSSLLIANTPLNFNGNFYRANLNRNGNSCGLYSDEINISVNPLPIVNSSVVLIQCDDDDLSTLGFSFFNLTEANNEISANANNETFTYFLTQAAAISGDITSPNFINNPTTFENRTISSDVVWARIESSFGCGSISEIQLNVSTTVIPSNFLVTFNQCDDFLDINGADNANNDDRDRVATFDFSSVDATILSFIPSGQNPLPPRYYRNEADALAEENEIIDITNYRNIGYPNSQNIYVRIDSDIANDCLGLGAHILLNVEPLPIANPVTINRQCDDDNDGLFPFDTSQIETDLLGNQDPADVTVDYFDELGNPLPSPLPNPFLTATQNISVRVTNNTTLAPDGPCYDQTTLEFIVDVSPIANPVAPFVVCDGESGDIDDDGLYPFNTANIENTVLGTQINMNVFFTYQDENGSLISNATSLPNPLISGSQTITVDVVNPINIACTATTNIDLTVNPLPEFSVETPRIVCSSDPMFNITLDPMEANITESFTYEWMYEGSIISASPILENVTEPGTYSVTLTKSDGTGCSRTRDIYVDSSELATITQDDITIVDLSENNSIIIDTSNLGRGNYEFALKEENSNFIVYQDDPFFNNVPAGFYTIYVKDAICGVSTIDISIIGYAKFFTPNSDGMNDYWQIKGINESVQPNSQVYIYDRYGKLLKQLLPQSNGWDGTFNGNLLPTDDYWFKLHLEDGRALMGHFTLKR